MTAQQVALILSVGELSCAYEEVVFLVNNKLKYYRKKRGITQIEFAKRLEISRRAYQYYESGSIEPKIELVKKMSVELGTSIEKIFPN